MSSNFVHIFEIVFAKVSGTGVPRDSPTFAENSQKDDKSAVFSAGGSVESRNYNILRIWSSVTSIGVILPNISTLTFAF